MRVLILVAIAVSIAGGGWAGAPAASRAWEGVSHPLDGWTPIDASQGVLLLARRPAASPLGPEFRRVWVRWEWTSPQTADNRRYLSTESYYDMDCANTKLRLISVIDYQDRDLNGEVVRDASKDAAAWTYSPPGTIDESLIKFACDKASR